MKLRHRIILIFGSVAALSGLMGLLGIQLNARVLRGFEGGEEHFASLVSAGNEISSYAKRAESHLMLYLALQDPADRHKFTERLAALRDRQSLVERRTRLPEVRQMAEEVRAGTDDLQSHGEELLRRYDRHRMDDGIFHFDENVEAVRALNEAAARIRDLGLRLAAVQTGRIGELRSATAERLISLQKVIVGLSLFLTLGVLGAGYVVAQNIVAPVLTIKDAADRLGRGDLDARVKFRAPGEIQELAEAFNGMGQDLKRSHGETITAKRYLDNVVRSMAEGLVVLAPEGRIRSVNAAACRLFGCAEERLVGRRASELIGEGVFFEVISERVCREPVGVERVLLPCRTADGKEVMARFSGSPLRDGEGDLQGVVWVAEDMTEHQEAEAIRRENERLALVSRAKTEFLATMSHELRTPLNSIVGFSQLLECGRAGELTPKQGRYVDNILAGSRHLLALINDILDLSKIEAGRVDLTLEELSLSQLVAHVVSFVNERAAKGNVAIETHVAEEADPLVADRMRLKQVLFNLVDNAVKFSKPEGGTVTVSASAAGDQVEIAVADTGIGVREEHMERLFSKFEQLDPEVARQRGGTGLGLAITRELVERHGGRVWATSDYGRGTTFTVRLPRLGPGREGEDESTGG